MLVIKKRRCAGGVDAVQALQLVFTTIGIDIQLLNKRRSSRLRWRVENQGLEGDDILITVASWKPLKELEQEQYIGGLKRNHSDPRTEVFIKDESQTKWEGITEPLSIGQFEGTSSLR